MNDAKPGTCPECGIGCPSQKSLKRHRVKQHGVAFPYPVFKKRKKPVSVNDDHDDETRPDWNGTCSQCGESPIVPLTGLCGPCTWGEAETIGGNW